MSFCSNSCICAHGTTEFFSLSINTDNAIIADAKFQRFLIWIKHKGVWLPLPITLKGYGEWVFMQSFYDLFLPQRLCIYATIRWNFFVYPQSIKMNHGSPYARIYYIVLAMVVVKERKNLWSISSMCHRHYHHQHQYNNNDPKENVIQMSYRLMNMQQPTKLLTSLQHSWPVMSIQTHTRDLIEDEVDNAFIMIPLALLPWEKSAIIENHYHHIVVQYTRWVMSA